MIITNRSIGLSRFNPYITEERQIYDRPVVPKYKKPNRMHRRGIHYDVKGCVPELAKIEVLFRRLLFEDNDLTYHELYAWYLRHYKAACMKIERSRKPKFVNINYHYFESVYKPLEQ